jgi:MFS family permease
MRSSTVLRRVPWPRLLQPLGQGQFALLWTGQTISRLGDGAYATVLTWTVYAISGSAAAAGYVLMAASIPQLVLLLAGGVVGDRVPRRSVILVSDTLSGLSVGAIAVLAAAGHLTVPALFVLSAIFGTLSAFFLPAYTPLIPEIVPEERLQSVNSLQAVTLSSTQIVGPSLGAILYAWGRAATAFGFDALTYFVAAAASLALRIPDRPVRMRGSIWADVREGWGYIRHTTWLWLSVSLASVYHVVSGAPFFVLLPAILRSLHLGVGYMGITFSILGVSGVVGNIIMAQLPTLRHRGLFLYGGWSLLGVAAFLVGVAPSYPLIGLAAVLIGGGLASETIWQTLVQQRVPGQYLSRVVSLDMLGSFALRPVGFAGAGILASAIGARPVLIAGGITGFALFALGALTPAIRQLD